ncbi:bacteriohemerythrin [Magnetospirillum sp. UT-4]|uniref:bacteriohemerythrin n=1 Tax=Magnetospirillum sp. UT-4 TaxID=2681467 RepID=UPI001381EAE0|nr:hemerythrin domain-containing protein [Magnetospirillum sp. UT-4]CAA7624598.1 Hemerythrin-like metal-binding protein [Magnetospirillum sp. UT-4]
MSVLTWHDGLNVGVGFMDRDHEAAAAQINHLAEAGLPERIALLPHFIDHCREHFAREEAMMEATGFFAFGCHQGEHQRVLAELDAVLARLRSGEPMDRYFTEDLPGWLMIHRNTMDFVTAEFARANGYRE